jgi:hypothetical protein
MKEIGILIFGFLLLYLYLFSYFFLTNNLNEWLLTFKEIKLFKILDGEIFTYPYVFISLISIGIIYIYFILRTKIISDSKVVAQRKRMITFNLWSVLMIVSIFISNLNYPLVLGYLYVAISIYLAILSQEKNPLYINELITVITLVALWL